jgi:hypothetical protein
MNDRRARARVSDGSGKGAGGDYPLGDLAGDVSDPLEIVVVVKHYETGDLGGSGDEKVGDLDTAMLSPLGVCILHPHRPVQQRLVHRDERPGGAHLAHGPMRRRTGREAHRLSLGT